VAVADDLQVASGLRRQEAPQPAVVRVEPCIATGTGRQIDARQIVMGLAQDLNTDRIELPGFPEIVARIHRALGDSGVAAKASRSLVPLCRTDTKASNDSGAILASWHSLRELMSFLPGRSV